ncbi:hypothetical protein GCM10023169_26060 [Georgenia halophila]|uniref:DUF222 domain-containing protein n=1 Tax=Georgenia halophila TaxID=620889 RepID=A0ABP8LDF0_9MICO
MAAIGAETTTSGEHAIRQVGGNGAAVPGNAYGGASIADRLAAVSAELAELAGLDLASLGPGELIETIDGVESTHRQLEGLTNRVLVAAEADGMWATTGARSFASWYAARTGRHLITSRRMVRHARRLRDDLPATSTALEAGQISAEHADVMAKYATARPLLLTQLRDPDLGEDFLIGQATTLDATRFQKVVHHWAIRTDPDAADQNWRADAAKEEVSLSATLGGYHLKGWLSPESGQVLQEALDARTGVPSKNDSRTPTQRRAHALTALARIGLDSGVLRPGSRIRPHLSIHVPYETLTRLTDATGPTGPGSGHPGPADPAGPDDPAGRAGAADPGHAFGPGATIEHPTASPTADGQPADAVSIPAGVDETLMHGAEPATLADGTPIPHAQLAKIACQSQLHRVIFGPDSEILDSGREERLFTPGQTRAIIARDGLCQFPDCQAPPGEGEIHHSLYWYEHGGTTTARLGVLLCWHHHDYVHLHNITIERRTGTWTFLRADGTPITPVRPQRTVTRPTPFGPVIPGTATKPTTKTATKPTPAMTKMGTPATAATAPTPATTTKSKVTTTNDPAATSATSDPPKAFVNNPTKPPTTPATVQHTTRAGPRPNPTPRT